MKFFNEYASCLQTLRVADSAYAQIFKGIDPPVEELYICSRNLDDLLTRPRVAIVGTRKITPYGRMVTERFSSELAGQGIVIVSGLAFGVDKLAHEAALAAGGQTIAVLPGSLSRIYPTAHTQLAERIINQGGALISEYPIGSDIAYKNQFIERNRIVAGISNALLITEAAKDSGTMHTAGFALNQGREVLAVPGDITKPYSEGTNNLLRTTRAQPATCTQDVLDVLHLAAALPKPPVRGGSAVEQRLLDLLKDTITTGEELLARSELAVTEFNQALTMMEITGKIKALGNNHWAAR